jgi:iron complex transport system substrate-binding protein
MPRPTRIVSLLPAATDIVATLDALGLLVGRTHECDWPGAGALDHVPVVTATDLPDGLGSREISRTVGTSRTAGGDHHGSSIYQIDQELLAELQPDLILTQDLCDVCAVSYTAVNDVVRTMDLDTRVLSLEPRTIGGILTAVDSVAAEIGHEETASAVRESAARRLAALPGARADGPSVLFVEWLDPLMPGGHWVPEQLAYAGGRSVFLGAGAHSIPVAADRIATERPDVIVFGPCGFTPARTLAELDLARSWPGWQDLPAVRNERVYVADGPTYFNRPGPRVIDGAEMLATIIRGDEHPEVFRVTAP